MNVTKLNTRSTTIATIFAVLLLLSNLSGTGLAQDSPRLQAARIQVEVISVHQNPRYRAERIISVRVTIRAGKEMLMIPNCATTGVNENYFCLARVKRMNGRSLIGTWGEGKPNAENNPSWHLTTINPDTEMSFLFLFGTGPLRVHSGESLQIGFEAWPNAESTNDWKKATILLSPPFEFPPAKN
jgi:hypothetical protein